MRDLLANAKQERENIRKRAIAHDRSAEHHRKRGVRLGVTSTIVSAIVGSAVFVAVMSQLGLSGKGAISLPSDGWARLLFLGVALLSILAPVLSGVNTVLNDPQEAGKHRTSSARYDGVQGRIVRFIAQYEDGDPVGTEREKALKEYEDIRKEVAAIKAEAPTLTDRAEKEAGLRPVDSPTGMAGVEA
jgi:hypothetical protein